MTPTIAENEVSLHQLGSIHSPYFHLSGIPDKVYVRTEKKEGKRVLCMNLATQETHNFREDSRVIPLYVITNPVFTRVAPFEG